MEKIFRCEVCNKKLANRHNLSRHRKTCKLKNTVQQLDSNLKPIQHEGKEYNQGLIQSGTHQFPSIQRIYPETQYLKDQITIGKGDHCSEALNPDDRTSSYSLNPTSKYSDESSMDTTDASSSGVDEISNYALSEPVIRKHCIWLPSNTRAIIVGKSGCGKTTLLSHFCAQMS